MSSDEEDFISSPSQTSEPTTLSTTMTTSTFEPSSSLSSSDEMLFKRRYHYHHPTTTATSTGNRRHHHHNDMMDTPDNNMDRMSLRRLRKLVRYKNYIESSSDESEVEDMKHVRKPSIHRYKKSATVSQPSTTTALHKSSSAGSRRRRRDEYSSDSDDGIDAYYNSKKLSLPRKGSREKEKYVTKTSKHRSLKTSSQPAIVPSRKQTLKPPVPKQTKGGSKKKKSSSTKPSSKEKDPYVTMKTKSSSRVNKSLDDSQLEKSIKNLETELKQLKNKTDKLEDKAKQSAKADVDPRLSLSSIKSRGGRSSTGSSSITTKVNRLSNAFGAQSDSLDIIDSKTFKVLKDRVDQLEKNFEQVHKLKSNYSEVEEKIVKLDERITTERTEREEQFSKTNKLIKNMEMDLVATIQKQAKELDEIVDHLKEIREIQSETESDLKKNSLEHKQLERLQMNLQSKLEIHINKLDDFSRRLDDLNSQGTFIAESNSLLKEQVKLLMIRSQKEAAATSASLASSYKFTAVHDPRQLGIEPAPVVVQTIRSSKHTEEQPESKRTKRSESKEDDRQLKQRKTRSSKNRDEDEGEETPSESDKYVTSEALYKQYHNLKKAYQRVFGSKKRPT